MSAPSCRRDIAAAGDCPRADDAAIRRIASENSVINGFDVRLFPPARSDLRSDGEEDVAVAEADLFAHHLVKIDETMDAHVDAGAARGVILVDRCRAQGGT